MAELYYDVFGARLDHRDCINGDVAMTTFGQAFAACTRVAPITRYGD